MLRFIHRRLGRSQQNQQVASSKRVARPFLAWLAVIALSGLSAACSTSFNGPDLAITYNASASYEGPDRNPIIVIPGLLGSKLQDSATQEIVWGAYDSLSVDPTDPEGLRLLALPVGDGSEPLARLRDDVRPVAVLDKARVKIFGIPVELEIYGGLMRTLGVGGYRDETLGLAGEIDYGPGHFTCFQFPYDWRRDIVESARLLARFIEEKRAFVQAEYRRRFGIENADVKFDIATHSSGGLVTRYYLMYGDQDLPADGSLPELTWAGAEYVERVILIGTPNAGTVLALENLIIGRDLGFFLPIYPPALIGTFPSTYQLLPRARHKLVVWDDDLDKPITDLLDPALWERLGWGLAAPDQGTLLAELMPDVADPAERRRRALALQAKILRRAEAFQRAMDRPATAPVGLEMMLVVGDGHETPMITSVSSEDGSTEIIEYGDGDGTVLRSSALMDERMAGEWHQRVSTPIAFDTVLFLPEEHVDLTRSPVFRDNILFWLLQDPRSTVTAVYRRFPAELLL